jgi:hypothetical protein
MSSTANPSERPTNPREATLNVTLGDHSDPATGQSLAGELQQATDRSRNLVFDLVRRNPIPVAIALAGLVWMMASRRRPSGWGR